MNGTTSLQLDASGDQAVAGLRVAMLPGANYRVVASTSPTWLGTLSAPQNRTDGAVLEGATVLPEGQQATPMVTAWRTFNLQVTAMPAAPVAQSAWEHQAAATCPTPRCIQGNQLVDTTGMQHPDHAAVADSWMGADVDATPASTRLDKHVVVNRTVTQLTTLTPLTPFDPAFNYALWDDEVASSSIWTRADDSLARTVLQDAYVEVRLVPATNPTLFRRNLTDKDVAALPSITARSPEYWTAPLVLAFEAGKGEDCDPPTEECRFGLSNGPEPGLWSRQPKVAIYAETIRDYSATPLSRPLNRVSRDEILRNTTAHEILHLFGLIHDGNRTQGGIMCSPLYVDANESYRTKVTPEQFKQIRQTTEMKIQRHPPNQPPARCP